MKKLLSILLIAVFLLFLGCSNPNDSKSSGGGGAPGSSGGSAGPSPSHNYYAFIGIEERITRFSIDPLSGGLSKLSGNDYFLSDKPVLYYGYSLISDPSGKFLFLAGSNNFDYFVIESIAIDPASGALTRVSRLQLPQGAFGIYNSPFITRAVIGASVVSNRIYILHKTSLASVNFDPASGALSGLSTVTLPAAVSASLSAEDEFQGMIVNPAGDRLYFQTRSNVSGTKTHKLADMQINADGSLSDGRIQETAAMGAMAFDPSGTILFIASISSSGITAGKPQMMVVQRPPFTTILTYPLDEEVAGQMICKDNWVYFGCDKYKTIGRLYRSGASLSKRSSLESTLADTSSRARTMAFDPDQNFLYVGYHPGPCVIPYRVNADGSLTELGPKTAFSLPADKIVTCKFLKP